MVISYLLFLPESVGFSWSGTELKLSAPFWAISKSSRSVPPTVHWMVAISGSVAL